VQPETSVLTSLCLSGFSCEMGWTVAPTFQNTLWYIVLTKYEVLWFFFLSTHCAPAVQAACACSQRRLDNYCTIIIIIIIAPIITLAWGMECRASLMLSSALPPSYTHSLNQTIIKRCYKCQMRLWNSGDPAPGG
jgi:hypothetical protein